MAKKRQNQGSGIQVQKPVLPKGGGTVQGMGETFAPNSFNGSSAMSIPLPVSPCRGFEPHLSLNYSSGNGNSPFGLGWELSTPEIVRRTSLKIPAYDDTDTFLYTAGDYMVPRLTSAGLPMTASAQINGNQYTVYYFMPCKEDDFDRIERYINTADATDDFWKITSAENTVSIFGKSATAKVFDSGDPSRIFKWLLEESYNDKGDHQVYVYQKENSDNTPTDISETNRDKQTQVYPASVYYGNFLPITDGSIVTGESKTSFSPDQWHFEVVFDYGVYDINPDNSTPHTIPAGTNWPCRMDPFSDYSSGFEIRTYRLCHNILLFHRFEVLSANAILVTALELSFNESSILTQLSAVKHMGYRYTSSTPPYVTKSLPELTFSYTGFLPSQPGYQPHTFEELLDENNLSMHQAANAPFYQLIDLYGEGIPGILYQDEQSVFYRSAVKVSETSIEYGAPVAVNFPMAGKISPEHVLTDVTGNGRLDLAITSLQQAGFWEMENDNNWKNFAPFRSFPTNYHYSLNNYVDVTGDGVADVVLIREDSVQYNASLNKKGFASMMNVSNDNQVPAGKQNSPKEILFFADFIGSGLSQRVRITQNSVECWPNLGYGKFGKKISMSNAPDFGPDFDISRLLWADINGSGAVDLAYIHPKHIDIYLNLSGNSFAQTPIIIPFPANWDDLSQISFADIKGNGTNCLVFVQTHPNPKIWYYDFNLTKSTDPSGQTIYSSQKPYLLCQIDNNMGAITNIHYSGSTKFYLKDKCNGTPWITHLPYPVNVIESVTHLDEISLTTTTSSYHYSHGYYDSYEKEFRGFGRVDVINSGSFDQFIAHEDGSLAAYNNPNAYTRTWYHTGALMEHEELIAQYKKEFWKDDKDALSLNYFHFSFLSQKQHKETLRDAHRTLYGSVIRSEVYGLDDSPWQNIPYTVSESQFEVREVQQLFSNKYSCFLLQARQSIDYDYERNASDPRINHEFVLATDFYGHILESCAVDYPRRSENIPDGMDTQTKAQQLLLRVSYRANTIFNSNEADIYWNVTIPPNQALSGGYLVGVAMQSKLYEILKLNPDLNNYFTWEGIKQQIDTDFQNQQSNINLLSWERSCFYDANSGKELQFGTIVCPALQHRTETAEFDTAKLTADFNCIPPTQLTNLLTTGAGCNGAQGGYITFNSGSEEDNYYWNPGSSQSYGNKNDFFLPTIFYDALNNETIYSYDAYFIYVNKVTDALDNVVKISEYDYQTMQPIEITDINGNTASVLVDALGVVIATSQQSKQEEGQYTGFTKISSFTPFTEAKIDSAFTNPSGILTNDSWMTIHSFFYYDLHSWKEKKIPPHFKSIVRNYFSIPAPGTSNPLYQLDVIYSDGFGRVAQHKTYFNGFTPVSPNGAWLASGTVRYDNKGQAVEKFEPWFDISFNYHLVNAGVSELLFYDALGREVLAKKYNSNKVGDVTLPYKEDFYAKTLFGFIKIVDLPRPINAKGFLNKKLYLNLDAEFTPSAWGYLEYDKNDCIRDSDYNPEPGNNVDHDAWSKAKQFANTPFQSIEDTMGNVVQSGQLNVPDDVEQNNNYFTFDILGDELTSADQRLHSQGHNNFQYSYNLSKQVIKTISVDAGTKWELHDVMNNVIFSCDSNNTQQYYSYDVLHRFSTLYVENTNPPQNDEPLAQVVRQVVYGDSQYNGTPYFNNPQQLNLRGKVVIALDEAGLNIHPSYDINGHSLISAQWIKSDYQTEANWNSITDSVMNSLAMAIQGKYQPADFEKIVFPSTLSSLLEPQAYITVAEIDAAGRIITSTDADGNTNTPQYYSNSWIEGLSASVGPVVKQANPNAPVPGFSNVQYNARGQRLSLSYANNTQTTYLYDDYSFELIHIETIRNGSEIVQQLHYHHDPVGNVTSFNNMKAPTVFYNNQQVDAKSSYTYDSLYRLKQATGREHGGMWGNVQINQNKINKSFFGNTQLWPQLGDGKALQNYTQLYQYDAGGNLIQLQQVGNTAYTRNNTIANGSNISNRIITSSVGLSPAVTYNYDNNGNMTTLEGCQYTTWNYRNNMQSAVVITRPNNENDAEYYVYNASGQRVRKIHRQKTQNGWMVKETLYIGGVEIRKSYTEGSKTKIREWHTTKLEDGDSTFCVWQYWAKGQVKPPPQNIVLARYQLCDVLNSSVYELDENANLISYEEYYPYGGTSIIAGKSEVEIKQKHYHYSAKEKDNVTGLYYYGMRYYATWIGCWTCTDPAGTIDGLNIYAFVRGNPSTNIDLFGTFKKKKAFTTRKGRKQRIRTKAGNMKRKKTASGLRRKKSKKSGYHEEFRKSTTTDSRVDEIIHNDDAGQDETFGSVLAIEARRGVLEGTEPDKNEILDDLREQVRDSQIPTWMVGFRQAANDQEFMQHPTSASEALWMEPHKDSHGHDQVKTGFHNTLAELREEHVVQELEATSDFEKAKDMGLFSTVCYMFASPLGSDQKPSSLASPAKLEEANALREELKDYLESRGYQRHPGTDFSKTRVHIDRDTLFNARSVSPKRIH